MRASRTRTIERRRSMVPRTRPRRGPDAVSETRRRDDADTLEELVSTSWNELVASVRANCPICGFRTLTPSGCESCGAELL